MKKKIALITGVSGQDGAYLAELLLNKMVIGRMKSNPTFKQRFFSRLVSPTRLTSA